MSKLSPLFRKLFPDAAMAELRMSLDDNLQKLSPAEIKILQLRYGLLDGKQHTPAEIGLEMGMTSKQVKEIESQALKHLRHPDHKPEA